MFSGAKNFYYRQNPSLFDHLIKEEAYVMIIV